MNDDAIDAASEIAEVFESLAIPYMVGGSLASIMWGEPRFTQDVDFVAALDSSRIAPFTSALGERWYVDESTVREAVTRRSSFNAIRLRGMIKVDVFVPPEEGLHRSKWGRVRRVALDPESDRRIAITSPEDILLQKLDWYRAGDEVSEQQWRDVTALLRIQGDRLDHAYLEEWAGKMGLALLLARARREA